MSIKSILTPVEDAPHCENVLGAALAFAKLNGGYIEGAPVGAMFYDPIAVGPMGGAVIHPAELADTADPEKLSAQFAAFMGKNGVARVATPENRLCYGWNGNRLMNDADFGTYARVFDVVVVGRPNRDGSGPRMATLECVLFEGGRPVLVAPPGSPEQMGQNVVVAWNCSAEAARTVSHAMALLEAAKKVCVLTVEGGTVDGPSGADLCRTLHAHGINAEEKTVDRGDKSIGEAILHHAKLFDADLIIKGAYTHSRVRQMIFGGATSHLIYNAELPVLMAS